MNRPPTGDALVRVEFQRLAHGRDLEAPRAATLGSAGWDLAAAVEAPGRLGPGERALIPTGLKVAVPAGYEAQVRPRSGRALREGLGLVNSPGTIDSDYRGEVGVLAINLGREELVIERGDRIAQMVIAPVPSVDWQECDELPPTSRDAGGFGSTGR